MVCQKFFLHLTKLKDNRLRHILDTWEEGRPFVERRGGDRVSKTFEPKKNYVRNFTGNLQGTESLYNRNKSKRIYLQGDLSIKQLCNIYNSSTDDPERHVKVSMFRKIYCCEFNIGFRSPSSDFCGYCTLLDNKIKTASPSHKQRLNVFMTLCVNLLNSMNQKCVLICNKCSHYLTLWFSKHFIPDN